MTFHDTFEFKPMQGHEKKHQKHNSLYTLKSDYTGMKYLLAELLAGEGLRMKAYIFPGHGAQFTGMGKDRYEKRYLAL